jgi:hypothetical protein
MPTPSLHNHPVRNRPSRSAQRYRRQRQALSLPFSIRIHAYLVCYSHIVARAASTIYNLTYKRSLPVHIRGLDDARPPGIDVGHDGPSLNHVRPYGRRSCVLAVNLCLPGLPQQQHRRRVVTARLADTTRRPHYKALDRASTSTTTTTKPRRSHTRCPRLVPLATHCLAFDVDRSRYPTQQISRGTGSTWAVRDRGQWARTAWYIRTSSEDCAWKADDTALAHTAVSTPTTTHQPPSASNKHMPLFLASSSIRRRSRRRKYGVHRVNGDPRVKCIRWFTVARQHRTSAQGQKDG